MHPVAALPNNIFVFTLEFHTVLSLHYGDDEDEDYDSENGDDDDVKQDVKALCGYSDTHSFIIMKNPSRLSFRHPHVAIMRGLTPSLKEVKLDTKNCIWETNFFLQDLISLRRIQNFKEIHLSIFSESIALGVTLVSDAPSNLAVPLPLFR